MTIYEDALRRAREASERLVYSARKSRPPRSKARDLSLASPDDKRLMYADARAGRLGAGWQRCAMREPIGVWIHLYEWRQTPPEETSE